MNNSLNMNNSICGSVNNYYNNYNNNKYICNMDNMILNIT